MTGLEKINTFINRILRIYTLLCIFRRELFNRKNQLISNSLAINSEYANKIALNTDNHFQNILKELKYSAQSLGKDFNSFALREAEVDRLKYQSDHYNSVFIGDAEGRLINFSPNILNIDRNKIQTTPGIQASLKNKNLYFFTLLLCKR